MMETQHTAAGIEHPERVLYPDDGITRGDLAAYYRAAAPRIVPHLKGRPLTLLRCPDGLASACFYQKNAGENPPPDVHRVEIPAESGARHYASVDSLAGILALVQRDVLEFHTWGATVPKLDAPDRMILDLDPDPNLPWEAVTRAAGEAHALLEGRGLVAFLKTTGGKGLHVVVPLERRHSWDEVRAYAKALADEMAARDPDAYTSNPLKAHRKGRLYIDYLRNATDATAVAAWSTRARPGAPISTPVDWEELTAIHPGDFTLKTIRPRLEAPDPWQTYGTIRQSLER